MTNLDLKCNREQTQRILGQILVSTGMCCPLAVSPKTKPALSRPALEGKLIRGCINIPALLESSLPEAPAKENKEEFLVNGTCLELYDVPSTWTCLHICFLTLTSPKHLLQYLPTSEDTCHLWPTVGEPLTSAPIFCPHETKGGGRETARKWSPYWYATNFHIRM